MYLFDLCVSFPRRVLVRAEAKRKEIKKTEIKGHYVRGGTKANRRMSKRIQIKKTKEKNERGM